MRKIPSQLLHSRLCVNLFTLQALGLRLLEVFLSLQSHPLRLFFLPRLFLLFLTNTNSHRVLFYCCIHRRALKSPLGDVLSPASGVSLPPLSLAEASPPPPFFPPSSPPPLSFWSPPPEAEPPPLASPAPRPYGEPSPLAPTCTNTRGGHIRGRACTFGGRSEFSGQLTSSAPPVAFAPLPPSLSARGPGADSRPGSGSPPLGLWCLLRACGLVDCKRSLEGIVDENLNLGIWLKKMVKWI